LEIDSTATSFLQRGSSSCSFWHYNCV